jgi:hypothetical protein
MSVACLALVAGIGASGVANASPAGSRSVARPSTHSTRSSQSAAMRHDLYRLRMCESGDHYHLNTGNGYYGAYQFSERTWRGLGFRGRPDRAKAITQNRAARKEHSMSGWSAWPTCSQRAHLR